MIDVARALAGWAALLALGLLAVPGLFALVMRFRGARPRTAAAGRALPRLVFLVPAHNERLLIRHCVRSLLDQDYPSAHRRVVVIADNCDDDTAAIARAEGAEVLERQDLERRGKPRALAWAIAQLGYDAVDAFVIIDADSAVATDYAASVARCDAVRQGAIQTYFGIANERETWLTRLAGVLMRLRYERQFPAKHRAGLNVPLTGNGMVLGVELLQRRPWQAFSVTEDWELYAEYTAHGETVGFQPEARLMSQEARSAAQSTTQRQRWQAGRREVRRRWGPAIRSSTVITIAQKVDAHLELYWPSPAVHGALVALALILGLAGGLPPAMLAIAVAAASAEMVLGLGAVLRRHPEPLATIRALAWAPFYVLWRVGIAVRARLSTRARREWVRTPRHDHL